MAVGKLRGHAWVFGDILDVDHEICPFNEWYGRIAKGNPATDEELGQKCMVVVDPDFAKKVKKGDFIVAGKNMGYGHDHDHACISIKFAGVAAVLCDSTNSNFFRNSIDHGLPVVEIPGIREATRQGDEMELDLVTATVRNLTKGEEYHFAPFPAQMMEFIEAGGVYPYLEKLMAEGKPLA